MDALRPVVAALAALDDGELRALIDAINGAPQLAPGLLAWIEHACDWELYRRGGFDFELRLPEAAIPPEEDAVSIDAAIATFATDAPAVLALFSALVDLLTGGAELPGAPNGGIETTPRRRSAYCFVGGATAGAGIGCAGS